MNMVEIEFIQDYKNCHKAGSRFNAQPHFAEVLIDLGYAKALKMPPKNKMIEAAEKEKYG
jgi:hypothetical protein